MAVVASLIKIHPRAKFLLANADKNRTLRVVCRASPKPSNLEEPH